MILVSISVYLVEEGFDGGATLLTDGGRSRLLTGAMWTCELGIMVWDASVLVVVVAILLGVSVLVPYLLAFVDFSGVATLQDIFLV